MNACSEMCTAAIASNSAFSSISYINEHTHTHTHTHRERERERDSHLRASARTQREREGERERETHIYGHQPATSRAPCPRGRRCTDTLRSQGATVCPECVVGATVCPVCVVKILGHTLEHALVSVPSRHSMRTCGATTCPTCVVKILDHTLEHALIYV